jgi:hypothetical protein
MVMDVESLKENNDGLPVPIGVGNFFKISGHVDCIRCVVSLYEIRFCWKYTVLDDMETDFPFTKDVWEASVGDQKSGSSCSCCQLLGDEKQTNLNRDPSWWQQLENLSGGDS